MNGQRRLIGAGAIIFSAFMALIGVPYGVAAPRNISNIVLSPLFWPYIVAGMIGLAGLALLLTRAPAADEVDAEAESDGDGRGLMRLALMAVIMAVYFYAIELVGMVWASMAAFVAIAFLIRTAHPRAAVLTAIVAPLLLYGFFAHVAGVMIPQGGIVRLP